MLTQIQTVLAFPAMGNVLQKNIQKQIVSRPSTEEMHILTKNDFIGLYFRPAIWAIIDI